MPTTIADHERNRKFAQEMNQKAVAGTLDIAKERTQYFEKLALGAGGSIALIVSYVGAHATAQTGKLHPEWLLRASLVMLFLSMTTAMLRNLRTHTYMHALYTRQYVAADFKREQTERDLIAQHPGRTLDDTTGQLLDEARYMQNFAEYEIRIKKELADTQKIENCAFTHMQWLERSALLLITAAMAMLIALAWINF